MKNQQFQWVLPGGLFLWPVDLGLLEGFYVQNMSSKFSGTSCSYHSVAKSWVDFTLPMQKNAHFFFGKKGIITAARKYSKYMIYIYCICIVTVYILNIYIYYAFIDYKVYIHNIQHGQSLHFRLFSKPQLTGGRTCGKTTMSSQP